MSAENVTEQEILHELEHVPRARWGDVLSFIRSLQAGRPSPVSDRPIISGADLSGSDLIGIWADRTDITDSREFARQLRRQADHRQGSGDVAGA